MCGSSVVPLLQEQYVFTSRLRLDYARGCDTIVGITVLARASASNALDAAARSLDPSLDLHTFLAHIRVQPAVFSSNIAR